MSVNLFRMSHVSNFFYTRVSSVKFPSKFFKFVKSLSPVTHKAYTTNASGGTFRASNCEKSFDSARDLDDLLPRATHVRHRACSQILKYILKWSNEIIFPLYQITVKVASEEEKYFLNAYILFSQNKFMNNFFDRPCGLYSIK